MTEPLIPSADKFMLKLNTKAPSFSLLDQDGKTHSLIDYRGGWVLIYFYPKDDTPGCIKEACSIRYNWPKFEKLDCIVLGISADSVKSHEKFSKKYKLPFVILADHKKEIIKMYGAWQKKKFMGKEYMGIKRMSYLVNPEGAIVKVYPEVKAEKHADEVLSDLMSFYRDKK